MGDSPSSDHDHLSHGHHHIIPDFIRHDEADLAIDGVREEHATRGRSPMAAASPAASTPMVAKTDSENVSPARPRSPSPSETVVEGVQFAEPSKPRTGAGLPGRAETMTTGSDNKSALNGLVGSRRGRDQHLVEFEVSV